MVTPLHLVLALFATVPSPSDTPPAFGTPAAAALAALTAAGPSAAHHITVDEGHPCGMRWGASLGEVVAVWGPPEELRASPAMQDAVWNTEHLGARFRFGPEVGLNWCAISLEGTPGPATARVELKGIGIAMGDLGAEVDAALAPWRGAGGTRRFARLLANPLGLASVQYAPSRRRLIGVSFDADLRTSPVKVAPARTAYDEGLASLLGPKTPLDRVPNDALEVDLWAGTMGGLGLDLPVDEALVRWGPATGLVIDGDGSALWYGEEPGAGRASLRVQIDERGRIRGFRLGGAPTSVLVLPGPHHFGSSDSAAQMRDLRRAGFDPKPCGKGEMCMRRPSHAVVIAWAGEVLSIARRD